MNIPEITYTDIQSELIFSKEFTAILFCNKSTAGSYLFELSLNEIYYQLSKTISVYKIDDFSNEKLAKDFKLYSEPSILFFYKNRLKEIIYGPLPKVKLIEKLNSLIQGCTLIKT